MKEGKRGKECDRERWRERETAEMQGVHFSLIKHWRLTFN